MSQQQIIGENATNNNSSSSTNIPVSEVYWSLVEKADKKFSKIRDLPYYERNRSDTYFYKVFKVYTQLWKFQQENRHKLVEAGLKRWEIGEIASRIAQLYYGQYMRTSDSGYLSESYIFYEAILSREYFKDGLFQDLNLANKQLRFFARFLMVCLVLNQREMVHQLVNQLKMLVDECRRTFQETDFKEWKLVVQEIIRFLKADTAFMNIRPLRYSFVLDPHPDSLPRVAMRRNLRLRDAILSSYHHNEVKFSELTLDTFRMLQCLEWEPSGSFYQSNNSKFSQNGGPLLNCYTKLKDVDKLNVFIKSEDGVGEHKFDVETAIRVCRAANYHEHAMYVAKKAGRHELYLKILLEDLGRYDEALQYISSLEPSQAGVTVKEYGKILIEHKPVQTIDILMRLCTDDEESTKRGSSSGAYLSMLPSPVDFLNIFIHHPESLMDFLEKYTNKVKDSPAQVEIHNTLLELYLSHDLNFPSMSQATNGIDLSLKANPGVPSKATTESNGKVIVDHTDANKEKDRKERQGKGLCLLKSAWPSDQEHPLYDVDLAIILCEMNAFKEGLLYLYEKMKLYKEVIACYMQTHDHEGLIGCCKRLGNSGKGGDPTLWADLLKYFGELGEDCSKEVKEVLTYIERDDILPPIIVLQTLSRNPCLTLSVIKDYIARKLEQESKLIEEDRREIEKYQENTSAMRKEIQDLRTNARIFQLSKCTACTFTLDLPAVHFMCMHSFHQRCLGDNEKECPECAPEYRSVLEMKRSLEQNSKDQDQFFHQVKSSKDGFSVIAEYFGKGIISKPGNGSTGNPRLGSTS